MFERIKRLLGHEHSPTTATDNPQIRTSHPQTTETSATPQAHALSSDQTSSAQRAFVCRSTLIDRHEHLVAHGFSLPRKLQAHVQQRSPSAQRAYDDALLHAIATASQGRTGELPGQGLLFIELSPHSLSNPRLNALPKQRSIVLLDSQSSLSQSAEDQETLRTQLNALKAQGLQIAWKVHDIAQTRTFLTEPTDFLQLAPNALEASQTMASLLTDLRKNTSAKIIASQLKTHAEFETCLKAGFDYFQGPFISDRSHWQAPHSEINRLRVLELLNLIRSEASFEEIAECLKTEPILTFKLLRYINSPALGLQRQIANLAQGLVILGREKFYRWLSLLLFDHRDPGYRERHLTEQALTRAHLLEGLAGQGRIPRNPEQLFMLGMFSLLDILLGKDMPEILTKITLAPEIRAALLNETGAARDALDLVIALESHDNERIAQACDRCQLDATTLAQTLIEAHAWAQSINNTADQT